MNIKINFYHKLLLSQKLTNKLNDVELIDKALRQNYLVTFINPYSIHKITAAKKEDLLLKFDLLLVDGILLVFVISILKKLKVIRRSFDMTSLAKILFLKLSKTNESVFLLGTNEQNIKFAVKNIRLHFKTLNIVGFSQGYFNTIEEKNTIIKKILKLNPQIIIVGMGSIKQEEFLIELKAEGWKGTGFTCGAFLEQTAKQIYFYPKIFNRLNLRWLYRILNKPELISRYFFIYPKELLRIIFFLLKI